MGINVTLNSTMQKLEKDHVVSWSFGKLFPEREIANNKKCPNKHGDVFDDVFLNLMNGDLIIPQITKNFHGKYYFRILKSGYSYMSGIYDVRVFGKYLRNITGSTVTHEAFLQNH